MTPANVSKHLQVLHDRGFVQRRKEGLFVRYRLASADVFRLCDIMCGRLETEMAALQRIGSSASKRRRVRTPAKE